MPGRSRFAGRGQVRRLVRHRTRQRSQTPDYVSTRYVHRHRSGDLAGRPIAGLPQGPHAVHQRNVPVAVGRRPDSCRRTNPSHRHQGQCRKTGVDAGRPGDRLLVARQPLAARCFRWRRADAIGVCRPGRFVTRDFSTATRRGPSAGICADVRRHQHLESRYHSRRSSVGGAANRDCLHASGSSARPLSGWQTHGVLFEPFGGIRAVGWRARRVERRTDIVLELASRFCPMVARRPDPDVSQRPRRPPGRSHNPR